MSDETGNYDPTGSEPEPWQPPATSPPPLAGPSDSLSLSGDIFAATATSPKRRGWLLPALGGLAAVVVLLGGVVGVKAYRTLSGGGPQPEKWAPASTFAFAKVDLDPPAGAKVAAYQFSQKFPSVPRAKDADSLQDTLLSAMFADAPVDYTQDIKPWAGDRLAVAAFNAADGSPQVVFIVAVKDSAKAQAALAKVTAEDPTALDVDVENDFILISPTAGGAHAAAQAARAGSLADTTTYKSDVGLLHSDRIVTAWFDIDETMKSVSKLSGFDGLDAIGGLGDIGGLGGAALSDATGLGLSGGRAAVAVRVAADYVELEARTIGATDVATAGEAGEMLGSLGSGTVAAVALSHPDELITKALSTLTDDPTMGPYLRDSLDSLGASLGLDLPGDLTNLLGSAWVLSLDAMPTGDSAPSVTSRSRPGDPARAHDTAESFLEALGAQGVDLPLDVHADGKDLLVTFGQTPAAQGRLADDAAYKKAMGSLPAKVQAAAYVNLTPIWDVALAADDDAQDARVLKSVGMVIGTDAGSSVARIRLVVGK